MRCMRLVREAAGEKELVLTLKGRRHPWGVEHCQAGCASSRLGMLYYCKMTRQRCDAAALPLQTATHVPALRAASMSAAALGPWPWPMEIAWGS